MMNRTFYEAQDNLTECRCEDCGKKFYKGDEGDNERFCLRCCLPEDLDYRDEMVDQ